MGDNKANKIYKVIMLILITVIATFIVTSVGMYNYFTKTKTGSNEILSKMQISDNLDEFENLTTKLKYVKAYLERYYIGELDTNSMTEMAIKGYTAGLDDDYTEYLTEEEYEDLMISVTGDYVGIGIYMYKDNKGNIVVLAPIEGSPAEEAGLQANDIIISIDGEQCNGMDIEVAASKVKGQEKSVVELEIIRGNETLIKKIQRRSIKIKTSKSEVLDENIGYISLSIFDEDSSLEIEKSLDDFKKQGIKKVIIDLRDNTGGIVAEAVNFCELFLDKDDIIMRSYDKIQQETVIKAEKDKKYEIDLVILVNGYSASATEIVAAALQDNEVATIVGTKTYGKGVMQEIIPIFEGKSALKITIEEFKTPNGAKIQKEGIIPDIEIEDDVKTQEDEQLQKAIELLK